MAIVLLATVLSSINPQIAAQHSSKKMHSRRWNSVEAMLLAAAVV
jgi:hypothetical protein